MKVTDDIDSMERECGVLVPIAIKKRVAYALNHILTSQNDALKLSPEYSHLVGSLYELEKQRPVLLMRLYYAEFVYMMR